MDTNGNMLNDKDDDDNDRNNEHNTTDTTNNMTNHTSFIDDHAYSSHTDYSIMDISHNTVNIFQTTRQILDQDYNK